MSLCVYCGQHTSRRDDVCAYHTSGQGTDWARGNRIMCDFVHRGIVSSERREHADRSIDQLVGALAAVW
jgi:hypothetical protein